MKNINYDSGAVNTESKVAEKDIVLADALELSYFLEQAGMTVKLTRTQDGFLNLKYRALIANSYNAPLISLHCNASNGKGTGFEAFTSPGQTGRLSAYIINEMSISFLISSNHKNTL